MQLDMNNTMFQVVSLSFVAVSWFFGFTPDLNSKEGRFLPFGINSKGEFKLPPVVVAILMFKVYTYATIFGYTVAPWAYLSLAVAVMLMKISAPTTKYCTY